MESARVLRNGERCPCPARVSMETQCAHEYVRDQCFVKDYWGARWLQVRALPHAIKLTSTPAGQTDGNPRVAAPGNILVHTASAMPAMLPASSLLEDDATTSADTVSTDRAGNDSAALQDSKPAAMVTLADTTDRPKKRRKVEYRTMIDTCAEICNIASKRDDTSDQVYGGLLAMLSILRGNGSQLDKEQSFRELIDDQERAFHGTRGLSRHGLQPVAARAPASGRPKENRFASATMKQPVQGGRKEGKCGFCKQEKCNVTTCQQLSKWGSHIKAGNLVSFMDRLGDSNNASPIPDGLLTRETPLLESLPRETEWISVARVHLVQPDLVQPNTLANLGVRLSCLGFGGTVLSQYQSRVAKATVVNAWIGKRRRTSFVLSLLDDVNWTPPEQLLGSSAGQVKGSFDV